MAKIIVLEGCDGSGKTTLGNMLRHDFDAPLISFPAMLSLGKDEYSRYMVSFFGYLKMSKGTVILDRSWVSEIVYAGIRGTDSRFMLHWLTADLYQDVTFIHCCPPMHVVETNISKVYQNNWVSKDSIYKIREGYVTFFSFLLMASKECELLAYDYTSSDNIYEELCTILREGICHDQ